MSAPHTDVEKQKKKHRAPLLGMRAVVLWALVLLALLAVYVVFTGNEPAEDEAAIDTEAGAVEAVE